MGGGELEVLPRRLELLDEVGGPGEQHAVAGVDHGVAQGGREVGLAGARRPEQQDVGALGEPAVALGQGE